MVVGHDHDVRIRGTLALSVPPASPNLDDHMMMINFHFSNKIIARNWLYEDEDTPAELVQIREQTVPVGNTIHLSLQLLSDSQSAEEIIKKELGNWLVHHEHCRNLQLVERAVEEATHMATSESVPSEEYDEVLDVYVEFTTEHDHIHELVDDADEYEDDHSMRVVSSEEYDEDLDFIERFTAEYNRTHQLVDDEDQYEDDYSIRVYPSEEVLDMYEDFTAEYDHTHELVDDADEDEDDYSIRVVPSEEYDEDLDFIERFTAEYNRTHHYQLVDVGDQHEDDYSACMAPATESSIRSLKRKRMDDCETNESCSICLDEFSSSSTGCDDEAVSMPCSHVFHGDCIKKWLRTSHYCPNCRHEMPTTN